MILHTWISLSTKMTLLVLRLTHLKHLKPNRFHKMNPSHLTCSRLRIKTSMKWEYTCQWASISLLSCISVLTLSWLKNLVESTLKSLIKSSNKINLLLKVPDDKFKKSSNTSLMDLSTKMKRETTKLWKKMMKKSWLITTKSSTIFKWLYKWINYFKVKRKFSWKESCHYKAMWKL